MKIDKHISSLLYQHDCVIVPGLGGFVANYKSALISSSKNIIYPPSKKIAFNARLADNDGLLVNYVSQQEEIQYSSAFELVNNFVNQILEDLKSGQRVSIENLGMLYYDNESNIQFFPGIHNNFLTDSFGLFPVNALQIERDEKVKHYDSPAYEFKSKPAGNSKKYWKLAEVIPVAVLLLFMMMYPQKIRDINSGIASVINIDSQQSFDVNTLSNDFIEQRRAAKLELQQKIKDALGDGTTKFSPVTEAKNETVDNVVKVESHKNQQDENKVEPVLSQPVEEKSAKYFIIVGSFKIEDNAKNFVRDLKAKGYNAVIPGKRKGLIMVSCFSSDSDVEIKNELQKVQSSLETQAWIYKPASDSIVE